MFTLHSDYLAIEQKNSQTEIYHLLPLGVSTILAPFPSGVGGGVVGAGVGSGIGQSPSS